MIVILGKKYITEREASARYGYSQTWFQKQRSLGKKPDFFKLDGKGKVWYPLDDTDEWFSKNFKLQV